MHAFEFQVTRYFISTKLDQIRGHMSIVHVIEYTLRERPFAR